MTEEFAHALRYAGPEAAVPQEPEAAGTLAVPETPAATPSWAGRLLASFQAAMAENLREARWVLTHPGEAAAWLQQHMPAWVSEAAAGRTAAERLIITHGAAAGAAWFQLVREPRRLLGALLALLGALAVLAAAAAFIVRPHL